MPLHDWTRVSSGLFHHFHQDWSIEIARALNHGKLPPGFAALVEQKSGPKEGDVLAIEMGSHRGKRREPTGNIAVLDRPRARIVQQAEKYSFARKANRIVVRHNLGSIVAVIEIVSPGNKDGAAPIRSFSEKIAAFLQSGIHALVVDLFPPTKRDPDGIHKAIWDQIHDDDFALPAGYDRILASYDASDPIEAFVEPVRVGDTLPEMPLFLVDGLHVKVPLESTYMASWEATPDAIRELVLTETPPVITSG